jgi:cytochrome c nitrite reductase small subunit
MGIARVPALAFARLVALMALIILPAGAVFLANYHTFEGVHEVRGCASCHVMLPMVNDMQDPGSETLAARHYKNKWIAENQCYHCHSDYGLAGDLEAEMTGSGMWRAIQTRPVALGHLKPLYPARRSGSIALRAQMK